MGGGEGGRRWIRKLSYRFRLIEKVTVMVKGTIEQDDGDGRVG